MATINNATRLGVPGLADTGDIDQDTLGVESETANALTNRYTDFDAVNTTQIDSAGLILNNSLTSQSIQYFLNRLIVGAGILVGTEVVNSTDDVFNILYTSGGNADASPFRGTWNITNGRVIRRTAGGGIYFFGRFSADSAWRATINGLDIESYGDNVTFHTGGLDVDNSVLNGVRLIGNSTAQLNAISAQFGFTAANAASNQDLDSGGDYSGVDYGYSMRFVHQGSPTSNISTTNTDASRPQQFALYTNTGLVDVVGAGSEFATVAGAQTIMQINRQVAVWLLNPNFGNQAGEVNAGRTLGIGFHSVNDPDSDARAAEIRTFIADRQTFQDANGADVAGTKVRYSEDTSLLPANYVRTTPPTSITNNETTVDNSNHRGVMVLSQRTRFADRGSPTTRDPAAANNRINALRTDITRTVRNFRYDYPYQTNLTYDPNTMAGLVAAAPTTNEGVDLNEFLNNRNAGSDLLNGISDFADEYAATRAY